MKLKLIFQQIIFFFFILLGKLKYIKVGPVHFANDFDLKYMKEEPAIFSSSH